MRQPCTRRAHRASLALLTASLALASACAESPARPSTEAVATIRVETETFRVRLTTAEQVAAANAARNGGPARIPNGRIVAGADINVGYSWHLENVEFVEAAIELCDGRPSMVEREGPSYGGGRFCPWGAEILSVSPL